MFKSTTLSFKKPFSFITKTNKELFLTKPKNTKNYLNLIKTLLFSSAKIINEYFNPALEGNPYEKL